MKVSKEYKVQICIDEARFPIHGPSHLLFEPLLPLFKDSSQAVYNTALRDNILGWLVKYNRSSHGNAHSGEAGEFKLQYFLDAESCNTFLLSQGLLWFYFQPRRVLCDRPSALGIGDSPLLYEPALHRGACLLLQGPSVHLRCRGHYRYFSRSSHLYYGPIFCLPTDPNLHNFYFRSVQRPTRNFFRSGWSHPDSGSFVCSETIRRERAFPDDASELGLRQRGGLSTLHVYGALETQRYWGYHYHSLWFEGALIPDLCLHGRSRLPSVDDDGLHQGEGSKGSAHWRISADFKLRIRFLHTE